MKIEILIFTLCLSQHSWAQEVSDPEPDECEIKDTTTLSQASIDKTPGYFFRPFPIRNKVSYASGGNNYIFDLDTGNEVEIPGPYDPVPTHDELIMTSPPGGGMEFHSIKDLLSGKTDLVEKDPELTGVYQSIGTLRRDAEGSVIRIISDKDELSYRDYRISENALGEPTVKPLGTGTKRLCEGLRIALPMLSKDGRQIAALDVDAQQTKIFDFDPDTGKCTEVLNIGVPAGKVDFNYNNDEIAFHVLNNSDSNDGYFTVPSDSMVANIYILKRSTGEIKRVTNNRNSNSVFPAWRKDGKLVYLHHPQRNGSPGEKSRFVVADPNRTNSAPLSVITGLDDLGTTTCKNPDEERRVNAVAALGGLWANICSKFGDRISATSASLMTLSLNPEKCLRMVNELWEKKRGEVLKNERLSTSRHLNASVLSDLTARDLAAVCPKKAFDPSGYDANDKGRKGRVPPVPKVCFECHSDDIPFDDHQALTTAKASNGNTFAKEIMRRIRDQGEDRMPPSGHSLSERQRQAFESYLRTGQF